MKSLLLLATAALAAFSQTSVTSGQVRTAAAPVTYRVFAFDSSGRSALLTLGAGVDVANGVISVKPGAVTVSVSLASTTLARAVDGTYPAVTGAVVYTRNGLLLLDGVDYAIVGGRLTPTTGWGLDDQVVARAVIVTAQ
jgi:hypothetical protein